MIAAFLPYIAKLPLAYAQSKRGYDNAHPRVQQAQLEGFGARCYAAHYNSFEALIVFGIAVLAALATSNVTNMVMNLAMAYIVSRVVYLFCYWYNLPTLRSTVWFIGLICAFVILGSCLRVAI